MRDNFLLQTDSYKLTHWKQYPKDAEVVYSYLMPRGAVQGEAIHHVNIVNSSMLTYYLRTYLQGQLFDMDDIIEAEQFCDDHFGKKGYFNRAGWEHILKEHNGRIPVKIKALPEGMIVPIGNPLMTVENTDERVPWITNYIESLLLKVWYPVSVATLAMNIRKVISGYLEKTGDVAQLPFKLHDFGYRGVSSEESAKLGGAAHLTVFQGSDNLTGIRMLKKMYREAGMPGFSVPASEHSTMTSWGKDHEIDAYINMMEAYPTGIISIVSDSYDIFNACDKIFGVELKDRILKRDGVVVIRPDSGDPAETIASVLTILEKHFGTTKNEKGYKELPAQVRLLQGDGVNLASIERILSMMRWRSFSANNIVFGMGGALLQKMDRDTLGFAFKCSAIKRAGVWHDVFKTASGKKSLRGRLAVIKNAKGEIETISGNPDLVLGEDLLGIKFMNGGLYEFPTLQGIREYTKIQEPVLIG